LFLLGNSAPHKAAITHQKLAVIHFEVLKHPAYSPDLAPSDLYFFPNLKKHLEVFEHWGGHINCRRVVCSTAKRNFSLMG
jgi:hypothetical protein